MLVQRMHESKLYRCTVQFCSMIFTPTAIFINVIRFGFKVITVDRKTNMATANLSFIVQEGNDAKTPGRDTSISLHSKKKKNLCQMELLNE